MNKREKQPKFWMETVAVGDAVSDAWSELEGLGNEMREAFDNTPESLQSSMVGEAREAAADALESMSEPDVDEKLKELKVEVVRHRHRRQPSRATRRDEAVEMLRAVVELFGNMEEEGELKELAENAASDIENVIDEAEAVEFPGMYG